MSARRTSDRPDFYLRYLLDYPSPELDTEVRACRTARWLHVDTGPHGTPGRDPSAPSSVLRVVVEPPLLMMGKEQQEVMLGPYYRGTDLVLPQDRSLLVRIYRVIDWSGVSAEKVQLDVLHTWSPAHIAPALSLLPPTREESFQKGLQHLRRYAAREGHTDVPERFKEDSYSLGRWVQNTRRTGHRDDESAQLAAIPEWRWLSSEETDLLRAYAEQEGHTDPPDTYVVDHLALENLVRQVRTQHARGLVSPDEVQRLEEIPYWHW